MERVLGRLTAADYEDDVASDPRIDELRDKMEVKENDQFTKDYFDPELRYIGNAVQVFFTDGTSAFQTWTTTEASASPT